MQLTDAVVDPTDIPAPAREQEQEQIPNYGEWNEDLPQQLKDAVRECVKSCQNQEQFDRRREVMRDRRNRFYERGYQHIYENSKTGQFTLGTPGSWVNGADGEQFQCSNYIDDYNIYMPFARIIYSVQTQNAPGINFRANDPSVSEDTEGAQTAEGYRKHFERINDTKSIQKDVIRMMALSGRTIIWTRTEENVEKWGYNPDGSPKKREVADVYGTLEAKVPILAKNKEACLYCIICDDPDVKIAKAKYPKFAKKIKPGMAGLGETSYERIARLGVLQGNRAYSQIGDTLQHLVTRSNCFLRPANFVDDKFDEPFEEAEPGDVNEDGTPFSVRDKLNQLYPLGVHAVFIGDQYVGSQNRSFDDCIGIGFPYPGEGMHRQAIMDCMIVVQDRFNDNMNAAAEVWDHGWPSTWVDADDIEYDAILEQTADPYAIRQKKTRGNGARVQDSFWREPNPELPQTFMEFTNNLEGPLAQFMIAAPPALFGAAMEDQKTASGYAQARNQAMGQQGLTWDSIQQLFATMIYQATIAASRNPDYGDTISVPTTDEQTETVSLEKLRKGNFGAYPDTDSSFPETTMQKRQTLTGLVTMAATSPAGAQVFESPDNWNLIKEYMGIPELVLPEAEARNKQMFEIQQLLVSSPVPDPAAAEMEMETHAAASIQEQAMGGPEPPPFDPMAALQPSVPVDDLDFHEWEAEKCKEWLSSTACRRELAKGNIRGVTNVRLHCKAHLAKVAAAMAMMQPQMPMPGHGGGTPPGGPPKPPVPQNPNMAPAAPTM